MERSGKSETTYVHCNRQEKNADKGWLGLTQIYSAKPISRFAATTNIFFVYFAFMVRSESHLPEQTAFQTKYVSL